MTLFSFGINSFQTGVCWSSTHSSPLFPSSGLWEPLLPLACGRHRSLGEHLCPSLEPFDDYSTCCLVWQKWATMFFVCLFVFPLKFQSRWKLCPHWKLLSVCRSFCSSRPQSVLTPKKILSTRPLLSIFSLASSHLFLFLFLLFFMEPAMHTYFFHFLCWPNPSSRCSEIWLLGNVFIWIWRSFQFKPWW